MRESIATCPEGSRVAAVVDYSKGIQKGFCLPNNVVTYPLDPKAIPGSGIPVCKPGDFTIMGDWRCLPATPEVVSTPTPSSSPSTTGGSSVDTPPPAPPAPPSSPAPPPTSQSYEEEIAAYENAITQALSSNDASKLPDIRARADRVIASLNKRIEDMTYLKKDTPDIRIERDRLLEVLRRIQNDYNGLRENTDDLETLRRIREQEGGAAKAEVMWYLIAFLIAVVALIGVIFMMGGQKALATAINPSTPAMSPPLM